jgi:hypothetical protein
MEEKNIKLRSEDIQEILTRIPNWMIRWGTAVFAGIILMFLFMSWLIKYPDIVKAEIIITTNIPPEKIIAKTYGKIQVVLIKDRTRVCRNTPLAVIENSANYKDVFLLKNITDSIDINKTAFPFEMLQSPQLGDIEGAFAVFKKEYFTQQLNIKLQPYKIEGTAQKYETVQQKERLNILESQRSINQNELAIQKNDLNRYENLFKKGVIAIQEFEKHKLNYLQELKNHKTLLSNISQLKSSLNDLSRLSKTTKINQTKESVNLDINTIQSFYQLKKVIRDWELNYVLRSSIQGKVNFLQIWTENQFVNAGDNIFSIIPKLDKGYIGKVRAIALNSGKIKIGQNVNIRLASYPDREFGILQGKLKAISLTADKNGNLLIDVSLPKDLETSYHKTIAFQQEMSGSAEIITEDLRLIERLLYQFRDVFKR